MQFLSDLKSNVGGSQSSRRVHCLVQDANEREVWRTREAEPQREAQLPSVANIQCTQNAGHGVVIPSGGGIAATPWVEHGRAIDVPRTSKRDALMMYGEPMPSVKAAG